jgi:ankyrin repeat protein
MRVHQKLVYAIIHQQYETIDKLLNQGMDLNAYDLSPIIDAMDTNSPQMVEYLLDRGADPNHQTDDGSSPLFYVFDSEDPVRFARILLAHGADPNLQNRDGDTILMSIIRDLQFRRSLEAVIPDIVLLLMQYGADIQDLQNNRGETVQDLALKNPSLLSRSLIPDRSV